MFCLYLDAKGAATQAKAAAKAVKKGQQTTRVRKFRTTSVFRRPKTLALARNPKYVRHSIPSRARLDQVRSISSLPSLGSLPTAPASQSRCPGGAFYLSTLSPKIIISFINHNLTGHFSPNPVLRPPVPFDY